MPVTIELNRLYPESVLRFHRDRLKEPLIKVLRGHIKIHRRED